MTIDAMTMPPRSTDSQQPFVILALPRTGSTLLTSLLDSHPQITCHNEPFNPHGIFTSDQRLQSEDMRAYRDEDPIRFMELLYSAGGDDRIVGFKILEYQARDVQDHLLQRPDIRKVILRRDNMLASYSSNLIANKVRQWRVEAGNRARRTTLEFDPGKFHSYVNHAARYDQHVKDLIDSSGSPMMAMEYRDLLRREAQKKLLVFLGADPAYRMSSTVIRQNPGRLRNRFSNWDQVVAALSGTAMDEWLHGD